MSYESHTISHDDWRTQYHPTTETPYETKGAELKAVNAIAVTDPYRIWTLVSLNDQMHIVQGMRFHGRLGFYITKTAYNPRQPFTVKL